MCLAEALLRIPDDATRDALIRDKIGGGDWRAHLGQQPVAVRQRRDLGPGGHRQADRDAQRDGPVGGADPPDRARRRAGDPQGRRPGDAHDGRAVRHRRDDRGGARNGRGREAQRLPLFLRHAGRGRDDRGRRRALLARVREGASTPSARRPAAAASTKARASRSSSRRCIRAMRARRSSACMGELLPRAEGAGAARAAATTSASTSTPRRPTGWSSRSTCSSGSASSPELAGWNGIGFVVQAYGKRCPFVIDWLIDLARRSGRRLMVRLVKGAYWDSEIKRAQVDGLDGFPVFTRKVHTDVSYLACAASCSPRRTRSSRSSPRTTPRRWRPSSRWPARTSRRPVRVPVPARHGRAALRRGGRHGQARPAVPHLCAGRHARDAARLPRAAPARERRQLLLRQPHRRSDGVDRRS